MALLIFFCLVLTCFFLCFLKKKSKYWIVVEYWNWSHFEDLSLDYFVLEFHGFREIISYWNWHLNFFFFLKKSKYWIVVEYWNWSHFEDCSLDYVVLEFRGFRGINSYWNWQCWLFFCLQLSSSLRVGTANFDVSQLFRILCQLRSTLCPVSNFNCLENDTCPDSSSGYFIEIVSRNAHF